MHLCGSVLLGQAITLSEDHLLCLEMPIDPFIALVVRVLITNSLQYCVTHGDHDIPFHHVQL